MFSVPSFLHVCYVHYLYKGWTVIDFEFHTGVQKPWTGDTKNNVRLDV